MAAALNGKVVVTGAASGIGGAVVERVLADGGSAVALDLDPAVETLNAHPEVLGVTADVADPESLATAVERGARRFGRLTGAVAAAGITRSGTVDDMALDDWNRVLTVNLTAVFLLAKLTFPHFRAVGGGAFVAIASQVGLVGYPENVAYCAAKSGVVNLVRAMAVDAGPEGIRSNAVCPGPVDTPMLRQGFEQTGEDMTVVTARVPAGRVACPAEIAATAAFLLGDDAAFVNGAVWTVDGGYTAQ